VYYKAREMAMGNNQPFHLAAFTKVGGSYRWGVNSNRKSTKFRRKYRDGSYGYHLHAEMDLLRKTRHSEVSVINVIRFKKDGEITMAKPCIHCQKFLKERGVRKVHYTNWDGKWETMRL